MGRAKFSFPPTVARNTSEAGRSKTFASPAHSPQCNTSLSLEEAVCEVRTLQGATMALKAEAERAKLGDRTY